MNMIELKRALAEAEARAKSAENKLANNGRKGFSIRESDKLESRTGPLPSPSRHGKLSLPTARKSKRKLLGFGKIGREGRFGRHTRTLPMGRVS